jgi:hypothetical protein
MAVAATSGTGFDIQGEVDRRRDPARAPTHRYDDGSRIGGSQATVATEPGVPPNNYASLGLQQDESGKFTSIPGFGVTGGDHTPESLANMSDEALRGLMLSSAFDAQNQANQANTGSLAEQLNLSSGFGEAARQGIGDVFTQERARSTQSLAARGLGSTTADDAAQAGLAGREARAVTRLEESVAGQKISILGGANFRQPDSNQLYNQMLQSGQSGMGQGAPDQPPWYAGPLLGLGVSAGTELAKAGISSYFAPKAAAAAFDPALGAELVVRGQSPGGLVAGLTGGGGGAAAVGYGSTAAGTAGYAGLSSTAGYAGLTSSGTAGYAGLTSGTAGYASVTGGTAGVAGGTGGAALTTTLMAVAPWIAAGVGAYFIYRNNKDKVDNLYDDAEEYVKDAYDDTEERIKGVVKRTGKRISRAAKSLEDRVKKRARKWGIKF